VLHLQCHFGKDSLVLASRGAEVTGLDFFSAAIDAARQLTRELGLSARFVQADVYDAPAAIPEAASFDLVFTTWGTITWLPDVPEWARVGTSFLRLGGSLYFADAHPSISRYFADAHPTAMVFDDLGVNANGKPGWFAPYFERTPLLIDDSSDYADPAVKLANSRQVNWLHTTGAILDALREAGLRLEWLHEHPRVTWRMFRQLVRDPDRRDQLQTLRHGHRQSGGLIRRADR
jgi:SAM-dependent methyltransferase